ncbi:hypothetical protein pEaSNUABM46_00207 [Erwinia phage pEa_SNUABM_46]|nr:hypothetical protein pEaSNUABM45_00207 [Erwinia phage pEa_SNUABM_45]QYW04191.1 hypothetical protein pEaSNUABM46_00207 [Erwinia phage pEa_SNUABM_46]
MELLVSLSARSSPLEDMQTQLENSKDELKQAQRRLALRRKQLNEKSAEGNSDHVASARAKQKDAQNSVKTHQDIVRINQQRVGRAGVVDRLVKEWNRLDKLKGTDQDTEQVKARRSTVAKQIVEARKALRAIKRPKSTIKKPKKPRRY